MNSTAYKRVSGGNDRSMNRTRQSTVSLSSSSSSGLGRKRIRLRRRTKTDNILDSIFKVPYVKFGMMVFSIVLLCVDIYFRSTSGRVVKDSLRPPPHINDMMTPRDFAWHGRGVRRPQGKERYEHSDQYHHSDSMDDIGDKSANYRELRKIYDAKLPENDTKRMKDFAQSLRKNEYFPIMENEMTYDIHNCPLDPPPNYPFAWDVKEVLDNWPPDDTVPRKLIYQGLCVFDFETQHLRALSYRMAEVPFVVRDDPRVLRTTERWNQQGYLEQMIGVNDHRAEFSHSNHFMYWAAGGRKQQRRRPKDWKPPTEMIEMSYPDWLSHANITDESQLTPNVDHWYFRLIGCGYHREGRCDKNPSEYLFDELPFFQPKQNDLYMAEPDEQKGIHCRFGMKGVIAENHFDGTRNMVAIMGGERRYILSHPDQCENLCLYPKGHPSGRHSAVDWAHPDWDEFRHFRDARVNEVVLQAGDVLYLPTAWFHYIISLNLNFQCNTRSGVSNEYWPYIHDCGF